METRRPTHGKSQPHGVALIASLLIMVLLLLMGMTLIGLALTENKLATNTKNLNAAFYVAEAGVESLFVDLRALLASTPNPPPSALPNGSNLASGGTRAPASPNYAFDFGGNPAATRVSYVRTTAPYSYLTTIDKGPYKGLHAFTTDYQINARVVGPLNTQARVSQVIQYQEIPLFQFGVFYGRGVDLEIAPGPPMIFNGRVHANSNIYVVANSGLQFDSFLTTAGSIYRYLKRDGTPDHYNNPLVKDANGNYQSLNFDHESNVGFAGAWSESDWQTQALSSFGGKVMDMAMGVTEITPPIPELFYNPSNPDAVAHQLIEKNVAGESTAMQAAKLYYQADLRIVDGVATLKDGSPVNLSLCSGTAVTTKSFYDKREGKTMTVTEVNVSALRTCPFLSGGGTLLYVSDGGFDKAVRLVNGSEVTAGGLTVVTDNPMYIQGDYNTVNKQPSAVLADAITILSNNWGPNDSDSKGHQVTDNRPAANTTVNAAFALGPSAESSVGQGNGQLENVIRFLENWSSQTFTYRGSIISLWHSQQVTGDWRCCGSGGNHYYRAPNRNWGYDTLFDTSLPPGTPRAVAIVKGRWQG